ncbi:Alpha/Beta hydrolase protein, partial [Globomyces pollinis-pini]
RGFPFQTHYVTTKDGYILALHRIPYSRSENKYLLKKRRSQFSFDTVSARPVVVLWHGFAMSSESWVSTPTYSESLAFTLADAGYDVWMANTRGNKYSCKHRTFKPNQETFWNFTMDQIVQFDIPDCIDYILNFTGTPSLTCIGFDQGGTQLFAGLSVNENLNKKVNLCITLAPVIKPNLISSKMIHSFINSSTELIFFLFGKKALLSSTLFWQTVLSPITFAWLIDVVFWYLFGWHSQLMISKIITYRHLYSYTSVKSVIHYFQMIKSGVLQMYDETATLDHVKPGEDLPRYPIERIQTPIALFYGGKDELIDIKYLKSQLPPLVYCLEIEVEYEHLQFIWGEYKERVLFPGILGLLSEYSEIWSDATDDLSIADSIRIKHPSWISEEALREFMSKGDDRDGRVSIQNNQQHGNSLSNRRPSVVSEESEDEFF